MHQDLMSVGDDAKAAGPDDLSGGIAAYPSGAGQQIHQIRDRLESDSAVLREPGSYPVRADASARRQALSDRLQGDVGLVNDPIQAAQGKAVDHLFAAAFGVDETAVPKAGKVGADPGLRLAYRAHQLTNSAFLILEQFQYVEPGRISQNAKEACRGGAVGWT